MCMFIGFLWNVWKMFLVFWVLNVCLVFYLDFLLLNWVWWLFLIVIWKSFLCYILFVFVWYMIGFVRWWLCCLFLVSLIVCVCEWNCLFGELFLFFLFGNVLFCLLFFLLWFFFVRFEFWRWSEKRFVFIIGVDILWYLSLWIFVE